MKKMKLKTPLLTIIAAVLLTVGFYGVAFSAPALDLNFILNGDLVANPNDPFTIDITATAFDDSTLTDLGLTAFGFQLNYTSDNGTLSILPGNTSIPNPPWFVFPSIAYPSSGQVEMGAGALPAVFGSDILLATIGFQFSGTDTGYFEILPHSNPQVGSFRTADSPPVALDSELLDGGGNAIFTYSATNAVPIPGAFLLLGSGLVGLVSLRKRSVGGK